MSFIQNLTVKSKNWEYIIELYYIFILLEIIQL